MNFRTLFRSNVETMASNINHKQKLKSYLIKIKQFQRFQLTFSQKGSFSRAEKSL